MLTISELNAKYQSIGVNQGIVTIEHDRIDYQIKDIDDKLHLLKIAYDNIKSGSSAFSADRRKVRETLVRIHNTAEHLKSGAYLTEELNRFKQSHKLRSKHPAYYLRLKDALNKCIKYTPSKGI